MILRRITVLLHGCQWKVMPKLSLRLEFDNHMVIMLINIHVLEILNMWQLIGLAFS